MEMLKCFAIILMVSDAMNNNVRDGFVFFVKTKHLLWELLPSSPLPISDITTLSKLSLRLFLVINEKLLGAFVNFFTGFLFIFLGYIHETHETHLKIIHLNIYSSNNIPIYVLIINLYIKTTLNTIKLNIFQVDACNPHYWHVTWVAGNSLHI